MLGAKTLERLDPPPRHLIGEKFERFAFGAMRGLEVRTVPFDREAFGDDDGGKIRIDRSRKPPAKFEGNGNAISHDALPPFERPPAEPTASGQ